MSIQLLVNRVPAHGMLDDVIVVGHLRFADRRLEVILAIGAVVLGLGQFGWIGRLRRHVRDDLLECQAQIGFMREEEV